jgi:1,2-diacylglycerol 3-alpha-glucosyltransferase
MIRLAVLFRRLGPYHLARLRATASLFDLTAIEYSNVDSTYNWEVIPGATGFRRTTLFSNDDFHHHSRSALMGTIGEALSRTRSEVVAIPGWGDRCSRATLLWCIRNRIPVVMMSDSLQWLGQRRWWKELIKRHLLSSVSAGLAAGIQHRAYLEGLGLPGNSIFLGFDVVDNDYFIGEARKVRDAADEFRMRHQLPRHYFLASSRFVPQKNLDGLLKAYAEYRRLCTIHDPQPANQQPWDLVLLGDGPLRSSIFNLRAALGLADCVHLPGFKQYGELPVYYALASAFIMPSLSETWSLSVNEAMACGLPVIVSTRCGCASELVVEARNGCVIDPKDLSEFARVMVSISRLPNESLRLMGQASSDIIANWGTDRFSSSMKSAAETALRFGPRSGTLAGRWLLNLLVGR